MSVTVGECGQVIYAYITSANTQRGGKYIFTQTLCALLWVLLVPVWYACAPMLITWGERNREEPPASQPLLVGSTHFAKITVWCPVLHHFLLHPQALSSWPVSPDGHCPGPAEAPLCAGLLLPALLCSPLCSGKWSFPGCPFPVPYRDTLIFKPLWTTFESELSFFSSVASSLCNHPVDKPYSLLMDIEH